MNIREYTEEDYSILSQLLCELQQHIINLDPDELNIITYDFWEIYTNSLLRKVKEGNGKVYFAVLDNEITGFIAGIIESFDNDDKVTYKCPTEGRIVELFVREKFRNQQIGSTLIGKMEEYFRTQDCKNVRVSVFSYNLSALKFYHSKDFKSRNEELLKRL